MTVGAAGHPRRPGRRREPAPRPRPRRARSSRAGRRPRCGLSGGGRDRGRGELGPCVAAWRALLLGPWPGAAAVTSPGWSSASAWPGGGALPRARSAAAPAAHPGGRGAGGLEAAWPAGPARGGAGRRLAPAVPAAWRAARRGAQAVVAGRAARARVARATQAAGSGPVARRPGAGRRGSGGQAHRRCVRTPCERRARGVGIAATRGRGQRARPGPRPARPGRPPADVRAALVDAEQLLVLARRVHNDAVRDTLGLRSHRLVRWLRLAGTAPMPTYFEIADPPATLTYDRVSPSQE